MIQGHPSRSFLITSLQRCLFRHHHRAMVCSQQCVHSHRIMKGTTVISDDSFVGSSLHREARRQFSDRLLGYSPMAPSSPSQISSTDPNSKSKIPTSHEVTTAGGVWAPTSSKRDKLAELKLELEDGQETLDDAASAKELLDLYLADGMQLVSKATDSVPVKEEIPILEDFDKWLRDKETYQPSDLDETQMREYFEEVSLWLSSAISSLPASQFLKEIRDFYDAEESSEKVPSQLEHRDLYIQDSHFKDSVTFFRLQLTNAAAIKLKDSWQIMTMVSDSDVDRAAVQGETIERQAKTLSLSKVNDVLRSHLKGTCSDRVDAVWKLMDKDEDGRLDEDEMNHVALLCLSPVQTALVALFEDVLNAYPVTAPLPEIGNEEVPVINGWRNRRKETKAKKKLLKMFQRTCKNHFEDEVEINHRLRCIYAWAEKAHQENKLDSVLVDAGWSGRKRYVELHPKISLSEFREVQQEHFTHFDRMGAEILSSFRNDLWVVQGKGRQNRELMRDCLLFLTTVSIVDYIILIW